MIIETIGGILTIVLGVVAIIFIPCMLLFLIDMAVLDEMLSKRIQRKIRERWGEDNGE